MRNLPKAGSRVGVVHGPGEFPRDYRGTVISHVTDRWGSYALVLMDDGTTRTCHGLTEVGIGWYLLKTPPRVLTLRCSCCDGYTQGRQHHNRDEGYGLCDSCEERIRDTTSVFEMERNYGIVGFHYCLKKDNE